jgi:hypothetical protein
MDNFTRSGPPVAPTPPLPRAQIGGDPPAIATSAPGRHIHSFAELWRYHAPLSPHHAPPTAPLPAPNTAPFASASWTSRCRIAFSLSATACRIPADARPVAVMDSSSAV